MSTKTKCGYCHKPYYLFKHIPDTKQYMWIEGHLLCYREEVNNVPKPYAVETSFDINYCPKCGRLLDGRED